MPNITAGTGRRGMVVQVTAVQVTEGVQVTEATAVTIDRPRITTAITGRFTVTMIDRITSGTTFRIIGRTFTNRHRTVASRSRDATLRSACFGKRKNRLRAARLSSNAAAALFARGPLFTEVQPPLIQ